MTDQPSTDAHTAAFRQIILNSLAITCAVPKAFRDGIIAGLKARLEAWEWFTGDQALVLLTLMTPGIADVREDPPVDESALWEPTAVRTILVNAIRALVAVPRDVRQAWADELNLRLAVGELLSDWEYGLLQVLLALPRAEDLASSFRQLEAVAS